jgi:hypothetical protein
MGLIARVTKIKPYQYHAKPKIPGQILAIIKVNANIDHLVKPKSIQSKFFILLFKFIVKNLFLIRKSI